MHSLEDPNRQSFLKPAMVLVGAAVLMALPAAAQAIETSRINSTVKIDRSDLQTQDGIVRVYKKLTKRAVKACENRNRKTTNRAKATEICEAHILGDFIRRIDNSDLTEYHQIQQE